MKSGTLCVAMTGGVPFILGDKLTENVESDFAMYFSHINGRPFQVNGNEHGMIGEGEVGVQRLKGVMTNQDHSIEWMYENHTSLAGVPDDDMVMPFPYDPTGQFPFMIGDRFYDRKGQVWLVCGFRFIYDGDDGAIEVVIERSKGQQEKNVGEGFLKDSDLQHFRLGSRRVVDWETYLSMMVQWSVAEYFALPAANKLGMKAPEVYSGQTPGICDTVRHFHNWSSEEVGYKITSDVMKQVSKAGAGSSGDIEVTDFRDWARELFRIYGRRSAIQMLEELIASGRENDAWGDDFEGSKNFLLDTMRSRYSATRLTRNRPDSEKTPTRKEGGGRMVDGEEWKRPVKSVYKRKDWVLDNISKGSSPDRTEPESEAAELEEMGIDDFLESM